jgi:hypothetical protein
VRAGRLFLGTYSPFAGTADDVVEDDIISQEIEEVVPISEAAEALFDNAEERVERRTRSSGPHGRPPRGRCAVRLGRPGDSPHMHHPSPSRFVEL